MSSRRIVIGLAIAAGSVGLALPGSASAAARSGVTLHHYYGGGVIGQVFSKNPERCAAVRKVLLFRETGEKPKPSRDTKVGKAHASGKPSDNGGYGYEVQYRRARPGHYYARIPAKPGCKADNSKTIHIAERPQTKINDWSVDHAQRSAYFHYKATGGVAFYHFRCSLDGKQFQHCPHFGGNWGQTGAKSYRNLSQGRHVFRVYAIGRNRKRDKTPAKQAFRIQG